MYVYHERQLGGLCGVHCLNNLLQGPVFGPGDLAEIGVLLDKQEQLLLGSSSGNDTPNAGPNEYNVDSSADGGNFSVTVLKVALERHGLELIPATHPTVKEAMKDPPNAAQAFICQYHDHWFTAREVGPCWWNLNSTAERPRLLGPFYLAAWLTQLKAEGYSIFLVKEKKLPEPEPPPESQLPAENWHDYYDLVKEKEQGICTGGSRTDGGMSPEDAAAVAAAQGQSASSGTAGLQGLSPRTAAAVRAAQGAGGVAMQGMSPRTAAAVRAAQGSDSVTMQGMSPRTAAAVTAAQGSGGVVQQPGAFPGGFAQQPIVFPDGIRYVNPQVINPMPVGVARPVYSPSGHVIMGVPVGAPNGPTAQPSTWVQQQQQQLLNAHQGRHPGYGSAPQPSQQFNGPTVQSSTWVQQQQQLLNANAPSGAVGLSSLREMGFRDPQIRAATALCKGNVAQASEALLRSASRLDAAVEKVPRKLAEELTTIVVSLDKRDVAAETFLMLIGVLCLDAKSLTPAMAFVDPSGLTELLLSIVSNHTPPRGCWSPGQVEAASIAVELMSALPRPTGTTSSQQSPPQTNGSDGLTITSL